jgi:hypothetical protein
LDVPRPLALLLLLLLLLAAAAAVCCSCVLRLDRQPAGALALLLGGQGGLAGRL